MKKYWQKKNQQLTRKQGSVVYPSNSKSLQLLLLQTKKKKKTICTISFDKITSLQKKKYQTSMSMLYNTIGYDIWLDMQQACLSCVKSKKIYSIARKTLRLHHKKSSRDHQPSSLQHKQGWLTKRHTTSRTCLTRIQSICVNYYSPSEGISFSDKTTNLSQITFQNPMEKRPFVM